jgi:HK97 family phage prohead protease
MGTVPEPQRAIFKGVDIGDAFSDRFQIVASTADKDRYGDIVEQDWDLEQFNANPVVLFAHDSTRPVGTVSQIAVVKHASGKRLMAEIELAPEGTTPDVDNLRRLVAAKIIRAASVGFYPGQIDEMRDNGHLSGFRFTKNKLIEISLVSVPANPNTLALSRSLNLTDDFAGRLFTGVDPLPFLSRKRAQLQLLQLRR